jgi:hypothetical protein
LRELDTECARQLVDFIAGSRRGFHRDKG